MNLLVLTMVPSAAVLHAQTQGKTAPAFALTIEEEKLSDGYAAADHELIVKYTNISETVQQDNCVNKPWVYDAVVLRDGKPVEKRKETGKDTEGSQNATEESQGPAKVDSFSTESVNCGRITRGINPGESVKFTLWVSSRYDMTAPGTYEVTVTRETYPNDASKSVTVRSNTITVVTPGPAAPAQ